jgi:hypothetical protein
MEIKMKTIIASLTLVLLGASPTFAAGVLPDTSMRS